MIRPAPRGERERYKYFVRGDTSCANRLGVRIIQKEKNPCSSAKKNTEIPEIIRPKKQGREGRLFREWCCCCEFRAVVRNINTKSNTELRSIRITKNFSFVLFKTKLTTLKKKSLKKKKAHRIYYVREPEVLRTGRVNTPTQKIPTILVKFKTCSPLL